MKKVKILLIALLLILCGGFFINSYASQESTISLKASLTRPFEDSKYTNPKYQYRVPGDTTDLLYTIVKIYDEYDKKQDNSLAYTKAIYCLRGGIGFGAEDVSETSVDYLNLIKGEMHTNAKYIIENYLNNYKTGKTDNKINIDIEKPFSITKSDNGVSKTETKNVNLYNAILWIIDEAYLPTDKIIEENVIYDASEYKKELLDKAGIPTTEQEDITDNDIEVIQQLAMWYFTNYDEQLEGIKPTVSQNTMFPAQFLSIDGDNNIDKKRANNLDRLYQYFIYGAIENANTYNVDATTGERTKNVEENKFDKTTTLTIKTPNNGEIYDYYEIGPIKFEGNSGERKTVSATDIILYDANKNPISREVEIPVEEGPDIPEGEGEITSGGKHIVYKFLDTNGAEVTSLVKGQEYKIRIYKAFEKGSTLIPDSYEKYDMSKFTIKVSSTYTLSNATFLSAGNDSQPVVEIDKEKISSSDEITTEYFDLALRKFIVSIGEKILTGTESRVPTIDLSKLNTVDARTNKKITTAIYTHPKNALLVEIGDKVIYTIRIYNEGEIDGTATKITDYLPQGLELVPAAESEINTTYGWTAEEGNAITTDYLKDTIIKAYDPTKTTEEEGWQKADNGDSGLYYADVQVECRVIAEVGSNDQKLRNIAEISEDNGEDRDSIPNNVNINEYTPPTDNSEYQQDDDDYENLVLKGKAFDLALRKYITSIKRNGEEIEFEDRTPRIDTTTLINGTFNRNGQLEYTATYNHSKEPLLVKQGDIITYTLRIYNEGDLDGYATEITDYIPEGLAFINYYNTNTENLWLLNDDFDAGQTMKLVGENGFYKTEEEVQNFELDDFSGITSLKEVELVTGKVSIKTNQLDDELLKSFDKTLTEETAGEGWQKAENGEGGLYYKDIQVSCLVVAENTYKDTITNIAEISQDKDIQKNDIEDRDSTPNNKKDPYTESQEDDDDYEPVILRYFDLALRKFITGVETNGILTDITSREPKLSIDEETGNIKYTHPKEEAPVKVANNDIVIYTLRIYNEGTLAGYAEEITDDIPEGLIFLPEHDINKQYEWKMFDKNGEATENLEDAVTIKTEYLSEANETENRNNILEAFDANKDLSLENPDYKDIKVAFRVIEPNTSDRIIVNSAQISEDSDYDEDSIPGEWNEGEDDQDKEYIYVKYFDLSLLKWVTQTIVTVDDKTTTTETGFKPNTGLTETTGIRDNSENEPVAKVEIDKNKINKTVVKFAYRIRVTNEGEIAGYATEVTDFIPEGLEFKAEDNKKYGWVKEGEDKVTTRALETVLLEPGESTELEIIFTWKNDKNNLGIKTNIAEITEDYNEHNSQDIDSTPNNKKDPYEKEQEDDDDFALVVLSLKTGRGASYAILITAVIAMLVAGIYLIKKYVLTY